LPTPPPDEVELLGNVRRCFRCHEWWPEDREFFYWRASKQCFDGVCIACRQEARKKKASPVSG
jgi:hypothetical protein